VTARRLALLIEYDGSPPLSGSQLQKNARSVQGELEAAVEQLTGERLRLAFAGRTDAGVHALGQVAAFTTNSKFKTEVFVRGLNALLPTSIAVQNAIEAPDDFDPRRHASTRTYRYLIYNGPLRSPLWRARAWHVANPLDTKAMQQAADMLIGQHDFAAFSRREGVTTVRCVRRCDVTGRPPLVEVEMEANAFLRHQVRRTVGALVQAGLGKQTAAGFPRLLRAAEPATAGPVAPACGLYLVRVAYPTLDLGPAMRYHNPSAQKGRRLVK
jgi:tRNA pseudouridine38-40 synthase